MFLLQNCWKDFHYISNVGPMLCRWTRLEICDSVSPTVVNKVVAAVITAAIRSICDVMVLIRINTIKNFELYGMQVVRDERSISRSGRIVFPVAQTIAVDWLVVRIFVTYNPEGLLAKIHTLQFLDDKDIKSVKQVQLITN